jgi:hypothetical protein
MSSLYDRIPTNSGNKTAAEIINDCMYQSYATQRDGGMNPETIADLFDLNAETAYLYDQTYIAEMYVAYASRIDKGYSHESVAKTFKMNSEDANRFRVLYETQEFKLINNKN